MIPGLRERNKLDKLRRIQAAAAELFTANGFEETKTKEIAERAGVGAGTVFLYARDKRDLLFQICLAKLDQTREEGFAKVSPGMPLLEQLLAPEAFVYKQVAKDLTLGRMFLEAFTFYSGPQANRLKQSRLRMISRIEQVISAAEQAGEIRCDEEVPFVARHLFFSSESVMRSWITGPNPRASKGLSDLRRIYTLHLRALNPSPCVFTRECETASGGT
jgi:AcrR family transcriptional regulator